MGYEPASNYLLFHTRYTKPEFCAWYDSTDDLEAKVNADSKAPSGFLNVIQLQARPQHQFGEVPLSAEEDPESFIINFFSRGLELPFLPNQMRPSATNLCNVSSAIAQHLPSAGRYFVPLGVVIS